MSDCCEPTFIEKEDPLLIVQLCLEETTVVSLTEQFFEVVFPCQLTINKNFAGGNNESIVCELEAATAINVNRVVVIRSDGRIEHADKDTITHGLDVIGMSRQSAAIGQLVEVVKFGKLSGAGFGTPGDNFWLGNDGVLLSSPPTSGFWLFMGTQMTGSEFLVRIGEPKVRS